MPGRFDPRRLAPLLVPLAAGALVGARLERQDDWELDAPAPAIALRPERLDAVDGSACTECHAAVAEEWARSAHGLAWEDEVYQEALASRRRARLCWSCHVSEPLLANGTLEDPSARAGERVHGVSCEVCHLGEDGAMLGPNGTSVDAHASVRSDFLTSARSSELCAVCHDTNIGPVIGVAKDFVESGQAQRGRSCVGCHMARVERAWATGAEAHAGRSHALQTPRDPAFLRRAFALERTGGGVVIANRAGHRVPGLEGRELRFVAEVLDSSGSVIERGELTLDVGAYLPVDGQRTLELEQDGDVQVTGMHLDPRASEAVQFLHEILQSDSR